MGEIMNSKLHTEMKRLAPVGDKVYPPTYREQAIANVVLAEIAGQMREAARAEIRDCEDAA